MRITNWSLQPLTSMHELTINLPNNPRLRGKSHHNHRTVLLAVGQGQKSQSLGFKLNKSENLLPDVIGDPRRSGLVPNMH